MKRASVWLLSLMLVLSVCIPATGFSEHRAPDDVALSVEPVFPSNQQGNAGFFQLRVTPGQQQTLHMVIFNNGHEEAAVRLSAHTASTNANGVIEYSDTAKRSDTLPFHFEDIVTIAEPELVIPAGGSVTASFDVAVPETPFLGEVAGAFVVTKLPKDAEQVSEGFAIRNVYAYAIGIRLREADETPLPEFSLQGVTFDKTKNAIQLTVRNEETLFVRYFSMRITIMPKGSTEPVIERVVDMLSLSPNADMPYLLRLLESEKLPAGDYEAQVELTYQDAAWSWEAQFTVDP